MCTELLQAIHNNDCEINVLPTHQCCCLQQCCASWDKHNAGPLWKRYTRFLLIHGKKTGILLFITPA